MIFYCPVCSNYTLIPVGPLAHDALQPYYILNDLFQASVFCNPDNGVLSKTNYCLNFSSFKEPYQCSYLSLFSLNIGHRGCINPKHFFPK